MSRFNQLYEEWLLRNIENEINHRRREFLEKGLGHGTVEFLRAVWFPAIGNLDHLLPEWEVRDFNNGYRYLDLAYMPGGVKGGIEIQGYGPHARDLDVRRFKDLCRRHCLLALDGWTFLPVAYPSIVEEPKQCQQLVLSFIGKFMATDVPSTLTWLEAETVRFARRLLRSFTPQELADHLHVTDRHARRILHGLVQQQLLDIASGGQQRNRTYQLRV
ncbi:transcriptional regulator [Paenibacillus sp. FSL R7-0331]|uniref:transcriptional regulator n=1 Tax=Paenibacillus sp. FSL R7-0331 TaxID=1536773 RepID=UPI0004F834F5|nr:transcriptional regulator [Paenibacillus sp. FSL R7-0331]AIQ51892.1 transcriptional regulator [Paenibacillus sp. FSL R7-0331]